MPRSHCIRILVNELRDDYYDFAVEAAGYSADGMLAWANVNQL